MNKEHIKRAVIFPKYGGDSILINEGDYDLYELADEHNAEKLEVFYADSTHKTFKVEPAHYCTNSSPACEPDEKCGCINLVEIKK